MSHPHAGVVLAALALACTPKRSPSAQREPTRTERHDYTCSARLDWRQPPSDAHIRQLDARCAAARNAQIVSTRVKECPCTELGIALEYRKDAASLERGMVVLGAACETGSIEACDAYELSRALCLRDPEQPNCEVLRRRKLIPTERFPLEQVLGCRGAGEKVLCFARDRFFARGRTGRWDQRLVLGWQRDDDPREARWEARLADGSLVLARGRLVGVGPTRELPQAELAAARAAIAKLPRVEVACMRANECIYAVEALLAPPSPAGGEGEAVEPSDTLDLAPERLPTLVQCEAARQRAVTRLGARPLPNECEP